MGVRGIAGHEHARHFVFYSDRSRGLSEAGGPVSCGRGDASRLDRYRLQVTLARETHTKLQRAQALSRHTLASGDVAAVLDRALTLLLDHLERRRFASVVSPRPGPGEKTASGRYIPAAVRRAVWQRDDGRCAFVGRTGRCRETALLEFHHVVPHAEGGAATMDNIQLRCRAHNQYEARLVFGDIFLRERPEVWEHTSPAPSSTG